MSFTMVELIVAQRICLSVVFDDFLVEEQTREGFH